MKRRIFTVLFSVALAALAACGNRDSSESIQSEDLIVFWTDSEELYSPEGENLSAINTQFYNGETVRIWSQRKENGEKAITLDIYLYREDGSSELLLSDISTKYRSGWFLDMDGNYYITSGNTICRLDNEGRELYSNTIKGKVHDICQLADGRLMVLVRDEGVMKLAELDADTGEITNLDNVALGEDTKQYLGMDKDGLLLLNQEGIWKINLKNGAKTAVISFEEYAYDPAAGTMDFRMTETGNVEVLESAKKTTLQLINISETREVIVLRDVHVDYGLEEAIVRFNKANEKYYVLVEECPEGTEEQDYINRTNIELGAGKGPDIITANMVEDVNALIEKGILENLTPYMEKSGILEEEYFPAAFDLWREGDAVYGINAFVLTCGVKMDASLVQGAVTIEKLLDALLNYQEDAVFVNGAPSLWVLDYFLYGTEDLWGMIEWESGTCDFSGELFSELLEVAKRYGDNGQNDYPAVGEYVIADNGFYTFETKEQLEKQGKIYVGHLFDDGCYAAQYSDRILAINSNSLYKDGIWELFTFLLSEEIQAEWASSDSIPVNKKAFYTTAQQEIEEGAIVEYVKDGKPGKTIKNYTAYVELGKDEEAYRALYDLTEEKVAEIEARLENTHAFPRQTDPILSIIYEEVGAYFAGEKSIEEVLPIIENRVQLYLNEKK